MDGSRTLSRVTREGAPETALGPWGCVVREGGPSTEQMGGPQAHRGRTPGCSPFLLPTRCPPAQGSPGSAPTRPTRAQPACHSLGAP